MVFFTAKNVFLINNFQRIKIGDWDAAIPLIQEMTRANMSPKGTPGYAAPEVSLCLLYIRCPRKIAQF